MPEKSIITLTTDFGETDYYVGAMKGVILSINQNVDIIDLSHQVSPHDIYDGAFLLAQIYRFFPARTIHVVVVDPGVGTSRRPLVVAADRQFFVAPDNGVLSLVYDQAESVQAVHATATHFFRKEISQTFHGRDIFAPLAAWLSRGTDLLQFGDLIADYIRLKSPQARTEGDHKIRGTIIKVDHFGNCVTNLKPEHLPGFFATPRPEFRFQIGDVIVRNICTSYAEAQGNFPIVILGSTGHLEISMNRGSASDNLKISRGTEVEVTW